MSLTGLQFPNETVKREGLGVIQRKICGVTIEILRPAFERQEEGSES